MKTGLPTVGLGTMNCTQCLPLVKVKHTCNYSIISASFGIKGIQLSISGNAEEKFSHIVQIAAPWNGQ